MTTATAAGQSRVLVVEDERALAGIITNYLTRAGYVADAVHTGPDAVEAVRTTAPDVVILDLGLPGMDGIEVCRRIRTFSDCYVLMVTARAEEIDTLIGLSVGADDYLAKPIGMRELVARVGVLLRRPRSHTVEPQLPQARTFGALTVDAAAREARLDGRPLPLTPIERDILIALASEPGIAFSRRRLIEAVWGPGWVGDDHLVDVHITHLRKKLGDDPEAGTYVVTVRGVGYRMGKG